MAIIRAVKHEYSSVPEPQVEDEIGQLVQGSVAHARTSQREKPARINDLNSVIRRISGVSVMEINEIIRQLQGLRDHLRHEAERVQREIAQYAQMSHAAAKSTKIIAETLSRWGP
jgi:hypothetical protein